MLASIYFCSVQHLRLIWVVVIVGIIKALCTPL